MPNASKYIIDVANIRPGGNPIKGLYVGSSEKKYATLGNKCIYDKVLYELSINNITNVEPNAQTVTISSYTSKRTHGNGTVDTLYINPSTKQVTANTSTASTKDTTVVVNQALTLNGTTTGTGVTVTITQIKDYPTGLTLTISPKSTIPASGGSISSALTNYTYSVKANHKSGNNNVDVTSDANTTITANVTGVTAASKGTTASTVTTAGTITFTAKYVCNGKTVTTTAAVNITQDKNEVVSYANPTFTLTPSSNQTLPASGGSVTAAVSNVQQVRTWSSTSTDTITPTSTTAWTAQTISCNSRGTVTGGTLTLGTTTATVTANGKSASKSYVVYQQANAITAYSKPTGLSLSCADIPAGGGTVTAATGGTISQTRTYTSKATDTINPTVTITWNPAQTATANSLGTTVKARTKITTLTATYSANGQSNSTSVDVYQQANAVTSTTWNNPVVTITYATFSAAGETKTPTTCSATQSGVITYTSTATASTSNTSFTWGNYSMTNGTGFTLQNATTGAIKADSRGTTTGAARSNNTIRRTATGAGSKQGTGSGTVTQQANAVTSTTWNNPVVTITYATFSAAGETKTPTTCSATQSGVNTYTSTATANTSNTSFTWGNYSMTNGTGFTLSNASTGAVQAASRGTTTGAARSNNTIRRTATGAGSKQGTGSGTVTQQANGHTDSWNNPVVTITYATFSAAGETKTPTTCSATQSGTRTWTSGSQTGITNTSFTWGNYSMTNGNGFTLNNATTGAVKANGRGTTEGAARSSNSITRTATGAGSKQGTGSVKATQEANSATRTWNEIIGNPVGSCPTIPASGGTVTATVTSPQTLAQKYTDTYTSGLNSTGSSNQSCTVAYVGGNTATAETRGTTTGGTTSIKNFTLRATSPATGSKTKDVIITAYQEANAVTSTAWNNPVVSISASPSLQPSSAAQTAVLTASATQSGVITYTSTSTASTSNSTFTWSWTTGDTTGFSSSVNNNVCTVNISANTSISSRQSGIYTATAIGAGSKSGSHSVFFTQSGSTKLTPKITSISVSSSDTPEPTSSYALVVISDTSDMSKDIEIAIASGNGTQYIFRQNNHPTGVVEDSFYEYFTTTSPNVYLYVKTLQNEGSTTVNVSTGRPLFNKSGLSINDSSWTLIGGGTISLTSSETIITLTFSN